MSDSQQTQQNQTNQTATNQQAQQAKKARTRKTIEQELAELEARRQRLLENKRKAEAHDKIVFGATVIAMLKDMRKKGNEEGKNFTDKLIKFVKNEKEKDRVAIEKIIAQISEIKPEIKTQYQR